MRGLGWRGTPEFRVTTLTSRARRGAGKLTDVPLLDSAGGCLGHRAGYYSRRITSSEPGIMLHTFSISAPRCPKCVCFKMCNALTSSASASRWRGCAAPDTGHASDTHCPRADSAEALRRSGRRTFAQARLALPSTRRRRLGLLGQYSRAVNVCQDLGREDTTASMVLSGGVLGVENTWTPSRAHIASNDVECDSPWQVTSRSVSTPESSKVDYKACACTAYRRVPSVSSSTVITYPSIWTFGES